MVFGARTGILSAFTMVSNYSNILSTQVYTIIHETCLGSILGSGWKTWT